ncbi:MAG TPA: arginase family protein [Gemmatimonadales bacterium]|jgi:arginase
MQIQILAVPYDSGHRGRRMGAGPEQLLARGLDQSLRAKGHDVLSRVIELPDGWHAEIETAFSLMGSLADAVRQARAAGRFPLILAGNCNTAVGTVAGLDRRTGVLWFDAHGDFNTPETSVGGFLDGMGLAIVTGRCWRELAKGVPGFQPVPDHRVHLLGVRDLDLLEQQALAASAVTVTAPADLRSAVNAAVRDLSGEVDGIYLHLDLDVLDPSVGRVNQFAVPGGLTLPQLERAVAAIGEGLPIVAATLSAYDPACDEGGQICAAALHLAGAVLEAAAGPAYTRQRGFRQEV